MVLGLATRATVRSDPVADIGPDRHQVRMKNVLFVCSQNKLRSPTAEQVFAGHSAINVASAGTNNDAECPLTPELVRWADIVFVMEKVHRTKLQKRFHSDLKNTSVVCLDIADDYGFMDDRLILLLKAKVTRFLPI